MTQLHEQIKTHLSKIRSLSTRGKYWSVDYVAGKIEKETDALRKLVGIPKPETLAASVLRLTDELLWAETYVKSLQVDLTDMTLNFNAAEKKNYELNLKLTQYKAGWYPPDYAMVEEVLKLRRTIATLKQRNDKLEQVLAKRTRYINRDLDATLKTNASLRRLLQSKRTLLENSEHALRHVRDQLETILEQTEQ